MLVLKQAVLSLGLCAAVAACDSGFSAGSRAPMSRAEAERLCRESWGAEDSELYKECVDQYVTLGGGWE